MQVVKSWLPNIPSEFILTKKGMFQIILIFLLLFSTYPYVFYRIIPLPPVIILQAISFLWFGYIRHIKSELFFQKIKVLLIFQMLGTIICAVVNFDIGYYKQLIYIIWLYVFLRIVSTVNIKTFLFYYGRILLFVGLGGALSTLLCLTFGVNPLFEYTNVDGRPGWFVYFTFTNMQIYDIIRYSGIFDEAGAFACWAMFYLVMNKIYIQDNKIEIPLILVTLFTFSFGYYIQLLLYVFYFYVLDSNIKTKIWFSMLCLLVLFTFVMYVDEDSPIYILTVERIGIDSGNDFIEDNNRVDMLLLARNMFYDNPLWGVGVTQFYSGEYAADNPYETLAKDGLIGTFFLYLPLLWTIVISRFNKTIIAVVVVLILGYLQRPFHTNLQHYLMLYLFVYCCYGYLNDQKNKMAYNIVEKCN